jgi:NAD(P)-dependent dehydrogenase (short-subunit alcohol dehydrogenase family)
VLVVDYDAEAAAAVASEVNGSAFWADVTDPRACAGMVTAAVDAFGSLDVAINNAGVGPSELVRTAEIGVDDWRRVLATNLDGVFYSMRAEIPALQRRGGGSIVNMASALAVVASVGTAAYVASKHGVLGLTRAAAIEYGRDGIRVNAVGPGTTETALTRDAIARASEEILRGTRSGGSRFPRRSRRSCCSSRGLIIVLRGRLVRRRRRLDCALKVRRRTRACAARVPTPRGSRRSPPRRARWRAGSSRATSGSSPRSSARGAG